MPSQKWYLHDAATTDTGTLPGATTLSSLSPTVTAIGASTNRVMNTTIGAGPQQDISLTTSATKSQQNNWFRRWVSAPIAAQTIPSSSSDYSLHGAVLQSNTNSLPLLGVGVFVWRPGTGAIVGTVFDLFACAATAPSGTTEEAKTSLAFTGGTNVVASDGDILVIEMWCQNTQGKASAYVNHIYYDGTTEDNTTTNAAYLLFPNTVAMQSATRQPRHPGINHQNPGIL